MEITPQLIERRLYELSKELDVAHNELVEAESEFVTKTAHLEVNMARSRIRNSHPDMKMTVQMREDTATVENEQAIFELSIAEAKVKASRANVSRIKTQVDIARSVSSSIKASMDL